MCAKNFLLGETILNILMSVSWEHLPTQGISFGPHSFVAVDSGRGSSFGEMSALEGKLTCVTILWPVVGLFSYEKAPSPAFSNRV